ncbi:hypothetical protein LINPERPRIM_LOCUS4874, partial [Linum perenne]
PARFSSIPLKIGGSAWFQLFLQKPILLVGSDRWLSFLQARISSDLLTGQSQYLRQEIRSFLCGQEITSCC